MFLITFQMFVQTFQMFVKTFCSFDVYKEEAHQFNISHYRIQRGRYIIIFFFRVPSCFIGLGSNIHWLCYVRYRRSFRAQFLSCIFYHLSIGVPSCFIGLGSTITDTVTWDIGEVSVLSFHLINVCVIILSSLSF